MMPFGVQLDSKALRGIDGVADQCVLAAQVGADVPETTRPS